jgi:hypothetical protein
MLLSLLRAIRDTAVVPTQPATLPANANVEGIEVHGPVGTKIVYTPSDRAEAPVDFGAGVAFGGLLFGAALWPAAVVGVVAAAAVFVVQEASHPKPAAPPVSGGNGPALPPPGGGR